MKFFGEVSGSFFSVLFQRHSVNSCSLSSFFSLLFRVEALNGDSTEAS